MWPLLLDMTKEESMQSLRNLELEAFAHLVSALRAQGPLDPDKKKLLKDTGVALNITQDRHKAEIRRAVNDEKLNTIAYHVTGLSESLDDWAQEGRRTVPLLPRTAPQTAYSAIADEAAENANQTNIQLPLPACTERKRTQSISQMMPESKPLAFRIPEPPKVGGLAPGMEQESKKRKSMPIENSSLAQHLLGGPAKINRPQHFYRQRPKSMNSMMKDQLKFKPQSPQQQMVVPQQKMPHSSPGINGPKINVVQNITLSSSSVPGGCVVGTGGGGEETIEQIQNEINNYTVQKPAEPLMPSCSNENQAPQAVAAAAAARAARLATPPSVKPTTANLRPSTGILSGGPSSSASSSSPLNAASCMSIGGGGGGGRESPKPCGGGGNQIKMMPSKKSTRPSPLAQKLIVVSNAAAAAHHQQAITAAAAAAAASSSSSTMAHHHHHHHSHPHHHQNSGGNSSSSILQKTLSIPLVKNISMRSLEKFKIVTTSSPQVAAAAAAAAAAGCNAVNSATFKHKVVTVKAGGGQGQSVTVGGNAPKKVIPLSQILTSKGGIKVLPIGGKIVGKTTTTTASSPLYIVNTMGGMGQNKSTISTHPPTSFTATTTTTTGANQPLPTPAPPPPPPLPSPPEVTARPGGANNGNGNGKENGKSSVLGDIMKASGVTTDDFDTQIEEFRIPTNNHLCNNNNVNSSVAMEIDNDQAQEQEQQQPMVQVMEEETTEEEVVVENEKSDDEHSQNVIIIQEDAESKTQIETATPPDEFSETKAPVLPPQQQQEPPPNVTVQVENFDSISSASASAAEN